MEARYEAARDALLLEFGTRWTVRKPWLMTVHRAFVVALFLIALETGPRFWGLLALYALSYLMEFREAAQMRRQRCCEDDIAWSTGKSLVLIGVGCSFTGGLASPLLPTLLAPVVIPAAAFGKRRTTWVLLFLLLALLVVLLVLPREVSGMGLCEPYKQVGIVGSIVFAVWVTVVNIVEITGIYTRAAVSAARMREEVLEAHGARAKELETLGAKVAHDLKNPLAAVSGLVQLLREGDHDARTRERLSVIASEVGRVEAVIREYLAFSRPLEPVQPADTELAPLADDVLGLFEARAREKALTLERRGDAPRLRVDGRRLRDALVNLVDNAIEASERGGAVSVELDSEGPSTSLSVRDHGPVIAPEVLARIGTPYFTTRESGTGLGVVIARAVVEAHGGTLTFTSTEGEGTVARITLPQGSPA